SRSGFMVSRPAAKPANASGAAAPRVLHIDTEPTFRGGEAQALLLIEGLAEQGEVALLAPSQGMLAQRASKLPGCTIYNLPRGSRSSPGAWLALRRAVAKFRPNLMHAHTSHGHALAWMAG